jgi:putative SOS response-associated peptidase YedK
MCGRFTIFIPLEQLDKLINIFDLPTLPPSYNVCPGQKIAAIRCIDDKYRLDYLHWGLIPSWAKDKSISHKLINARAETITEKPSFRNAFHSRRCLIPANGFYDWCEINGIRTPHYFHLKDNQPMMFAGLWDHWKSPEGEIIESCTIITTPANTLVQNIHDRMPAILQPAEYEPWLSPDSRQPELVQLLQPYPPSLMTYYPVSTLVNSPRNNSADLIKPA